MTRMLSTANSDLCCDDDDELSAVALTAGPGAGLSLLLSYCCAACECGGLESEEWTLINYDDGGTTVLLG